MSKMNQIESALLQIDQAKFHKLCDLYLHRCGYENINPLGVLIGSDKVRKGTPDTFFVVPHGKYIFAEYSTQQTGLFKKFLDDVTKCFNESKTGVPVEKIQEIILCHNSILNTTETELLTKECQRHGCLLTLIGTGRLSHDLFHNYPGIAKDILGIDIDTGQIVSSEDFVSVYNKNALAAPLDTPFQFREEEVEQVLTALEHDDLLLITGYAGGGKSRLGLECCRRFFTAHPEYMVRCIYRRGPDLFDDLRVHFSPPGHYLIFVDDANRLSSFDYVLQYLHEQRADRHIKIIATVREYAVDRIRTAAKRYGGAKEVQVAPFTEKEIRGFLTTAFGITNHLYLDRIFSLSHGNPRLAVMAARVAVHEQTLLSIADVSSLYDQYFHTVREDLSQLGEALLVRVGGIIAFFRSVDRSHEKLMQEIRAGFGILPDEFWQAATRLHDMEVVDIENEVVRISDQVLGTYLFYLAFFRDHVLDLSVLLERFWRSYRSQFVDALNPVLSAFNREKIAQVLRPHIDRFWQTLIAAGDDDGILVLIEHFWFLKPTETLLYVRNRLSSMESVSRDLNTLNFKRDTRAPVLPLLGALSRFRYGDEQSFGLALALILEYVRKRPDDVPSVLRVLTENFGFRHTSYLNSYRVERTTIETLWKHTTNEESRIYQRMFLAVASDYLQTEVEVIEPTTSGVRGFRFHLPSLPEVNDLRQSIWQNLFALYQIPTLQAEVLDVLRAYIHSGYHTTVSELLATDAEQLLSFIDAHLQPSAYGHCLLVQEYERFLRRHEVPHNEKDTARFTNDTYVLSQLLRHNVEEWGRVGSEEYEQQKRQQIEAHFLNFSRAQYEVFFEQCAEILSGPGREQHALAVMSRIVQVLLVLGQRNPSLFVEVLTTYLESGNLLDLAYPELVQTLTEVCGPDLAYERLSQGTFRLQRKWLLLFYQTLPQEQVTANHVAQLYALYQHADPEDLPYDSDYLLKYLHCDQHVVTRITAILTDKAETDSRFGLCLAHIFISQGPLASELRRLFCHEVELLKRAYFAAQKPREYTDYSGDTFNLLLDLDPEFATAHIDWVYKTQEWPSTYNDHRDYRFLWLRDDYHQVMERMLTRIFTIEQNRYQMYEHASVFIHLKETGPRSAIIADRQRTLLCYLIQQHHTNPAFMRFVFSIIAGFPPEERRAYVQVFLSRNNTFSDFRGLPLSVYEGGWVSEELSRLYQWVEFLTSLRPLFNNVELLEHQQYVEQQIERLHREIERQKKREFVERE